MSRNSDTVETVETERKPGGVVSPNATPPPKRYEPGRFDDDEEERTFFQRHRVLMVLGILAVLGVVIAAAKSLSTKSAAPHRAPETNIIQFKLPPLPPPPPPPPPPPQIEPPKQEMIEQSPVDEKEEKPAEKPDPVPALSTNLKGNGPDTFGLAPVGSGPGLGGLGSGRRGSRFGWYAAGVQMRIRDEMAKNRKTRTAKFSGLQVRIWADANGRINRAELKNSTGDTAVDSALRNDVLTGLTLKEPPPPDMPMPITLRISAQRQN